MQNVSHRVASRNDFESRDRIALHHIASRRIAVIAFLRKALQTRNVFLVQDLYSILTSCVLCCIALHLHLHSHCIAFALHLHLHFRLHLHSHLHLHCIAFALHLHGICIALHGIFDHFLHDICIAFALRCVASPCVRVWSRFWRRGGRI